MADPTPFEAIVERITQGQAPLNVRGAAARGALPLSRTALVHLYLLLRNDEEESVRQAAESSLSGLTEDETLEVLGDTDCTPEVLTHFAKKAAREEAMAERIAFHPKVPLPAMIVLAALGNPSVVELVLTNQEQLRAQPVLLDRLILNPALRADQRGRILELLDRVAKAKPEDEEQTEAAPEPPNQAELEETARLLDVDVGELLSESEILGAEELRDSDDPAIRSAFQKIIQLNAAQKALLAMKGGREERLILVRDSNKVVALSVLKNPRINENEIEAIAKMRNVTDEVLRNIGNTREWVKGYTVAHSLVSNPRTPQSVSMNLVSRLTNRDLKSLLRSRDVPELIRRMARRTHDLRTQRQSSRLRKH